MTEKAIQEPARARNRRGKAVFLTTETECLCTSVSVGLITVLNNHSTGVQCL